MTVTTHMCRGNFRSAWAAEGSYDFVAEALFNELEVDGFFMEWDDARSGSFEPLRFVPKDKVVVLGLVTTKTGELETKNFLKRRIEEASKYVDVDQLCLSPQCGFSSTVEELARRVEEASRVVPLERLALSPQCGFASTWEGNRVSPEVQRQKLEVVARTARAVWRA